MAYQALYKTLLTTEYKVQQALNFIESFGNYNYYAALGKSNDTWSYNEQQSQFRPPFPIDSAWYKSQFSKDVESYIKLDKTSISLVIPRNDWGDPNKTLSRSYIIDDIITVNSIAGVNTYPESFDKGIEVYKCITAPNKEQLLEYAGTTFPKYNQNGFSYIDTGDGYAWLYLYTIPYEVSNKFTNPEYIPVPSIEDIDTEDDRVLWNIDVVNTTPFDIARICYTANATTVMNYILLTDQDIISPFTYRQVGIIKTPWEFKLAPSEPSDEFPDAGTEGQYSQTGWKIVSIPAYKPSYIKSEILQETGEVLYIENRPPITKQLGEIHDIRIIIGF